MFTRDQAFSTLNEHIKGRFMINHHLGAEAVMRAFARYFASQGRLGQDLSSDLSSEDLSKEEALAREEELWGVCGLIHDLDWEYTKDAPDRHTIKAAELLRAAGADEVVIHAMQAHHPSASGVEPSNLMERCLYTTEELTGLIIACALVQPDKKLASVTAESVMRKLKDKAFAKGVNREIVGQAPEALGMDMPEVIRISLEAMQGISEELGL